MSQNPYQAPLSPLGLPPGEEYNRLPWYRKSSYVSWITALGLRCGPAILAVCIIVVTGEVYYSERDANGNLKKWGFANKVVAVVILLFQILFITSRVTALVRH